ncbi:tRNA pseudouridine(13) synthase TruD [Candidatus Woesearchaeota archaeon]|nr:tRNA pseudouridine(13) synthase TruD [Candidatus Woesearchaeota archaeon]
MGDDYKLKQLPEDFCVEEVLEDDAITSDRAKFVVYEMIKKDYSTFDAIDLIASALKVDKKKIGYAGLKDKHAVTKQFITFPYINSLKNEYEIGDIRLSRKGYRNERLFPGCLLMNKFIIVVRNITNKPEVKTRMINYFGEQRFSTKNIEIGRNIIKGNYAEAVLLIKEVTDDHAFLDFIDENPTDYIAALAKLRKNILRIYLQAYQSYLWNEGISKLIQSEMDIEDFPLPGFDIEGDKNTIKILDEILTKEGISERDFILPKLPGFGLEGGSRRVFVDVYDAYVSDLSEDELNEGMKKNTISFTLPKGSYATEYIKQLFLAN